MTGSFLEFLGLLDVFRNKYSPRNLPFHLIVPSLPGYGYSSGPPLDKNWSFADAARVINKLMVGLSFGSGYVSQGGDIGSFLSRVLGAQYDECKGSEKNVLTLSNQQFTVSNLSTSGSAVNG
jgi:microsomal epoxide hydrolase